MGDNSNGVRTMVLVGRTGNGKSATGNSILGRRAFKSRLSSSGVTKTCEMKTTVLKNGQIVNVIDTPGFFDFSADSEFVDKEIIKCIDLAKNGIHAILLVFSVRTRFSQEEKAAIRTLKGLFGSKIIDYTIVVFTGGDELEQIEKTFEDYLGHECPEPLKEILLLCENRCVLFDNKTKDATKKDEQFWKLLSLVNSVIVKKDGQPYTNKIFAKFKEIRDQQVEINSLKEYSKREISKVNEQMRISYEEQLKKNTEMIESKHREKITMLEKQLAEVQAVRLKELKIAQSAQIQSDAEIGRLKEDIKRAEKENEELRNSVGRGATKIRDQQVEIDSLKEYSKQEILKVEEQMRRSYEEQLKQITEMIESKHRVTITMLEQQLAEEQAVRLKVLEIAQSAQIQSDAEIGKLKEDAERAEKENDELRNSVSRGATKIRDQQVEIDSLKEYSKQEILKVEEQMRRSYEEQLKQITEIESKHRVTITMLEQQLAEEQAVRLKVLEIAQSAQIQSDAEIGRLKEDTERVEKENDELRNSVSRGATKIRDQQVEIDSLKEYSKQEILKVEEQMRRSYEEQLKQITEMESKLRETITRLEQLLAEEQAAQLMELEIAQSTKIKSDAEICRLREDIERAEKENKELCNNIGRRRRCDIL